MKLQTKLFRTGDIVEWHIHPQAALHGLNAVQIVQAVVKSIEGQYARIETIELGKPVVYTVLLEQLKPR